MSENRRLLPGTARVSLSRTGYTPLYTHAFDDIIANGGQGLLPHAGVLVNELVIVLHVREYWAHVLYGNTLGWVWAPHLSNA